MTTRPGILRRSVALLFLPAACMAQGIPPTTATWADSARAIKLPLETVHDLVIVHVSINGSRPLRMILDTGAKVML